jgi:hypothetical protein
MLIYGVKFEVYNMLDYDESSNWYMFVIFADLWEDVINYV